MEWEVVARNGHYIVAQFKLEQSAADYCRWRNGMAQRRVWRYRRIETDIVVNLHAPHDGVAGCSAGLT